MGEEGHHPIAGAERGHGDAGLGDRAGTFDAENVWHVEAEIARDATAHVEIEMIEADRLELDEDVVRADRGRFDVLVDQLLRARRVGG